MESEDFWEAGGGGEVCGDVGVLEEMGFFGGADGVGEEERNRSRKRVDGAAERKRRAGGAGVDEDVEELPSK